MALAFADDDCKIVQTMRHDAFGSLFQGSRPILRSGFLAQRAGDSDCMALASMIR